MAADLSQNAVDVSARGAPAASGVLILRVNGEERQTTATTLAALIAEAGYGDARVATAVNGTFVPARARAGTQLAAGDHIEIVAPRQGG